MPDFIFIDNPQYLYAGIEEADSHHNRSGFYPGIHYMLGSWYTPQEIGKRAMVFWLAGSVGTMFSGFLQAAAYTNLSGAGGLAGWRWYSYPPPLFFFFSFLIFIMHRYDSSRKKTTMDADSFSNQRLFIIDAIITIPLALAGFIFFPNMPHGSKTWWISEEEHAVSIKRMEAIGRAGKQPWTRAKAKKILRSWHTYLLRTFMCMTSTPLT